MAKSAKNQNKTQQTQASVSKFLASIKDKDRREEVRAVIALMKGATKQPPKMWGSAIVGFGKFRYKGASGREGDWFITGVSPRKSNLTVYICPGLHRHAANLKALGKVTTGMSCIYVKRLSDVKLPILRRMASQAIRDMKKLHFRQDFS